MAPSPRVGVHKTCLEVFSYVIDPWESNREPDKPHKAIPT